MSSGNEDRRLCSKCVGESFLQEKIQYRGTEEACSYCEVRARTFSIGEIADEIELALKEHYDRTPGEPSGLVEYEMWKEGVRDWDRKGDPITDVIEELAGIDREPAEDVQKVLEDRHFDFDDAAMGVENPFDAEAHYARAKIDATNARVSWNQFETSLRTEARYFNKNAERLLSSIFEGIRDHQRLYGNAVIIEAGPGKELAAFYRARVFQSDEKLEDALKRPDRDIGPPPSLAAASGRMNARGISVFYGATNALIALAEVRPPVGSKAVVARFDLVRNIQLLDVEALRSAVPEGSVFDRNHIRRLERAEFLKWLSDRITMPVMPDDEPFDYLATQVVADFLAASADPPLDGMLFRSAQGGNGQLNVVLFHKAARIQTLDVPRGTIITSQLYFDTQDGYELFPWVYEIIPEKKEVATSTTSSKSGETGTSGDDDLPDPTSLLALDPADLDGREATLKLDLSTITIHEVKSVSFETNVHLVNRHRN